MKEEKWRDCWWIDLAKAGCSLLFFINQSTSTKKLVELFDLMKRKERESSPMKFMKFPSLWLVEGSQRCWKSCAVMAAAHQQAKGREWMNGIERNKIISGMNERERRQINEWPLQGNELIAATSLSGMNETKGQGAEMKCNGMKAGRPRAPAEWKLIEN